MSTQQEIVENYHKLKALVRLAFDYAQARRARAAAWYQVRWPGDVPYDGGEEEALAAGLQQEEADCGIELAVLGRVCELLDVKRPELFPNQAYRCPECHSEVEVRVLQAETADPEDGSIAEMGDDYPGDPEIVCRDNEHDCSPYFSYEGDNEGRRLKAHDRLGEHWDSVVKGIWREIQALGVGPAEGEEKGVHA